jgi:hypothetical protein
MAEESGFNSRQGQKIFLFCIAFRLVLGHTQPPVQWVPGDISPEIKTAGHETDNSTKSSADVKNGGAISPLPQISSWRIA